MYIVAIDGSTSNSGVAVFQTTRNGGLQLVERNLFSSEKAKYTRKKKDMSKTAYKLIHAKEKREHMEKAVLYMMESMDSVLERYKPGIVVMEDTYGQNDMMTLKMLSRIQGNVIGWCQRNHAEIYLKTPSNWRKQVGMPLVDANGKSLKREQFKELARLLVKQTYQIDVTDDEADAICIGLSVGNAL